MRCKNIGTLTERGEVLMMKMIIGVEFVGDALVEETVGDKFCTLT